MLLTKKQFAKIWDTNVAKKDCMLLHSQVSNSFNLVWKSIESIQSNRRATSRRKQKSRK